MYIENISLKNFRNYQDQKIYFNKGINFITGENAQGKTNILEAIYISAIGKSFRTNKDTEIINFEKEGYNVEVEYYKENRTQKIMIGFDKKNGKIIKANGIKINKFGELLGKLIIVIFTPDDLKMIKDSPVYRRKFLDFLISQIKKSYLYDLQEYNKILEQRNALLKQLKFSKINIDVLDILDETLSKSAIKVINKRGEYVDKIQKECERIHLKLTDNKEILKINYKNSFDCDKITNRNEKEVIEAYKNTFLKKREIDIQRGFTSVGPHRDDIEITINKLDLEKYGSQGQQRTVTLSLKLTELEIIKQETNETPILLLDDVFSELDEKRREYLKDNIENIQCFITSTEKENIKERNNLCICISEGKLQSEQKT